MHARWCISLLNHVLDRVLILLRLQLFIFFFKFFGYFPLYPDTPFVWCLIFLIHKASHICLDFPLIFPSVKSKIILVQAYMEGVQMSILFLIFPDKTQHHRYTIKAFWLKCFSGQMFADEPSNLSVYKILILPNVRRSCLPGYSFSRCIV